MRVIDINWDMQIRDRRRGTDMTIGTVTVLAHAHTHTHTEVSTGRLTTRAREVVESARGTRGDQAGTSPKSGH